MNSKIKVIDLFCGIGGMTHGFVQEGFNVVAGIDCDVYCRYGYEANNPSKFIHQDIMKVTKKDLLDLYGDCDVKVLIGCAPCQPYSKLNIKDPTEKEFAPLEKFAQLISEIKPDVVSMENVKELVKYPIFETFKDNLKSNGYECSYGIVNAADYGVPQKRKRLVLLASRMGDIKLIERTHKNKYVTVRDVISHLDPIEDGECSAKDPLHRARKLSDLNKKRIKATPVDGGSYTSWSEDLLLECRKKDSGKSYSSVYGRMRWNEPAPTMTTQCIGLGNGRFGHPEQNRAISIREAAIFQSFPEDYRFVDYDSQIATSHVVRFIGNAVPVKLGAVIAKSIKNHIEQYGK